MKRLLKVVLFSTFFLLSLSSYSQSSNKYRALTIGAEYGNNFNERDFIIGTVNLYYELGNQWAITSWNGYQIKSSIPENRWSTSELMLRKQLPSGISFSTGVRRNARIQTVSTVNTTFAVLKVGYKIKL